MKLGFDRARARDVNWLFTTHRIPAREGQHVQDQYFEFLDALGVPHGEPVWDLGPWPEERAWQREFLAGFDRPIAPIVVATSKPEKDWLPERWAEVCDALWSDFGLQPVLVGGRSPRELAAEATIVSRRAARRCTRRWAADCASSSASSTARRWCCRPTRGRCTWPSRSTGRSCR